MRAVLIASSIFAATLCPSAGHTRGGPGTADSSELAYTTALLRLSSPKLEERRMVVRSAQRKGYAGTLKDMLTNDGLSALLSFLRTRLQIEFSISHEPILVDITYPGESPAPTEPPAFLPRRKFTIVLPTIPRQSMRTAVDIDWTFPEDPWRRE